MLSVWLDKAPAWQAHEASAYHDRRIYIWFPLGIDVFVYTRVASTSYRSFCFLHACDMLLICPHFVMHFSHGAFYYWDVVGATTKKYASTYDLGAHATLLSCYQLLCMYVCLSLLWGKQANASHLTPYQFHCSYYSYMLYMCGQRKTFDFYAVHLCSINCPIYSGLDLWSTGFSKH